MTRSRSDRLNALCIRPLGSADAAALPALYNELANGPKTARIEDVRAVMDQPGTTIFGAELDGRILGMITLHLLANVTMGGRPYGLVENVITTASHRGNGVGRAVMQAVIDHARTRRAYKIMLLTGQNRDAHGFYEALGFDAGGKIGMVLRFD